MSLSNRSRLIRFIPYFLIPIVLFLNQFHAITLSSDSAVERFRTDAIKAWNRLEMQSEIGSGLIQMDYAVIEANKITQARSRQMLFYRNKRKIRIDSTIKTDPPTINSFIAGETYGARFKKDNDERTYRVEWLGSPSESSKSVREGTYYPNGFNARWSLWSTPLQIIVEKKEFRLHGAEEVEVNGRKRIIVSFECVTEDPAIRFYDASLTMSPEDDWAIVEADFVVTPARDWKYRTLNVFDRQADGMIVRRTTKISTIALKSDTQSHRSFEFDKIQFNTPADEKFTLTDFGLPEPALGMNNHFASTTHFWLFAIASILFMIAFGLNRAARLAA